MLIPLYAKRESRKHGPPFALLMSNLSQLFDAGRFPGGVEVRPDGKAAVMTLRGPENGSLRLFSLGEGVILSFNRIDTQVWPLAQAEANNILLLNFCQKGRCEVALDDGQFAFLSQGYMAVGTQQAQEEYCYPGSLYEGIELFLDLDALSRQPYPLFQESEVSPEEIMEHLLNGNEEGARQSLTTHLANSKRVIISILKIDSIL